jgi:hypothetical protein
MFSFSFICFKCFNLYVPLFYLYQITDYNFIDLRSLTKCVFLLNVLNDVVVGRNVFAKMTENALKFAYILTENQANSFYHYFYLLLTRVFITSN